MKKKKSKKNIKKGSDLKDKGLDPLSLDYLSGTLGLSDQEILDLEKEDSKKSKKETSSTHQLAENLKKNLLEEDEVEVVKGLEGMKEHKKSVFKEKLKNAGLISLGFGAFGTSMILHILVLIFYSAVVISVASFAYGLFQGGSIIMALLVVFIGLPIILWLVSAFLPFFIILAIISGIIWLISMLLGVGLSFAMIYSNMWNLFLFILIAFGVFYTLIGFVNAIKEKNIKNFAKEHWFYLLLVILLLYLLLSNIFKGADNNRVETYEDEARYQEYSIELQEDLATLEKAIEKVDNQTEDESGIFADLNTEELDIYSSVLAKVRDEELSDADLLRLRKVLLGYTERTGMSLKEYEYDMFKIVMKLMNNYEYELARSTLFSWDQQRVIETDEFTDLFEIMELTELRDEYVLKSDIEVLKAAVRNQDYLEDYDGQQYEFSRDGILSGIEEAETAKKNTDKIVKLIGEFVEY